MEVRYRNDLYGNYMLIEIPGSVDSSQYSFKMLEKNKIPGVLPCKERVEDGKGFWYVDISKKRTLAQEYKDKEMQLEEMVLIFQQITTILEDLRMYLLNETMVVIDPEYIFRDIENDSLYVLILPWNSGEKVLHKLAEFFLEKINHRDENGVNAAYLFYRQQSQPNFSLYQFLPVLEKESILKRQKMKEKKTSPWKDMGDAEEPWMESKEKRMEETFLNESVNEEKEKSQKDNSREKIPLFFLIVSIIFVICSFLPGITFFLKISCRSFSFLLFLIFLIWILFQRKNTQQALNDKNEEFLLQEIDVGMRETVFFDSYDNEEYLKLQWKEKGRKKQFVLKDFPCTVGKMKEEVSLCISDASVSRIHCKFIEKDGKAAIVDMNSTNGTFLNGLPVKNGEILEIEKNDEILLGKVSIIVV